MTRDHVRSSLLEAVPLAPINSPTNDITENSDGELEIINGAAIPLEPIRWCWPGWLARGKFHVLAGAAGTGKTSIAIKLAAAITSGGHWPNGDATDVGDVLIWSGEDDAADTLLPRFVLAGGDRSRLHFVGAIKQGHRKRPFDPAVDVTRLAEAAKRLRGLTLLVIDPVSATVAGDSHKNAETRRSLQPLVDLATELDCAVVGITHFAKGTAGREPLERVLGSVAFGAAPRVVWATSRPNEPNAPRRLVRVKSNLGPDGDGVEYTLSGALVPDSNISAQHVEWGQLLLGTVAELMATEHVDRQQPALSEANTFLLNILQDGPVPIKEIEEAAKAHGHSMSTVRRAQKALGVRVYKSGFKLGWYWTLSAGPIAEDDHPP